MKTLAILLALSFTITVNAQNTIPKKATKIVICAPRQTYGQALLTLKRYWAQSGITITIDTAAGTYTTGVFAIPKCAGTMNLTGICHSINDTTWITTSGTYYSVPTIYGVFNYPWCYASGAIKKAFKGVNELLLQYYPQHLLFYK